MEGVLLIVSGPSGAGKGTVVERLAKKDGYALSISATTRSPRPYETDGIHYFFKTKEEFAAMQAAGALLEHAEFCGNCYGTPKQYVEQRLQMGENVLLEIEVQGALQVKAAYPDAVLVFLMPPSRAELRHRLVGRGTEDSGTVERRMNRALEEIKLLPRYDYVVTNDTVENAVAQVEAIVQAERLKCSRNPGIETIFERGE